MRSCLLFLLTMVCAIPTARAGDDHEHGGDFIVGFVCVSPGGQLEVEFDFDEITHLDPVTGVLEGFALDDPGFATLDEDELDEGFCVPDPTSNLVFEVLALDPAFQIHTPGFTDVLTAPGQQWNMGAPPFDTHATWHIDSTNPAYVADQFIWSVTFRLLDTGPTGYSPSEEFTVLFSNIECEMDNWQAGDCNLNGLADDCELATGGAAVDSDGDGILNDCDCDATTLLAGDANGDQQTDVGDIVYLLNALFGGGPTPATLATADGNASDFVDVADAVFLIAFLFESGPIPRDPCF